MSPLWRDELTIGFAPGRLELVRRARGWRPAVAHAALIEYPQPEDASWTAGIAALGAALADPRWQRAQCRFIVSNHHVRFALIDAPAELSSHDQHAEFVALRYRAIYGDCADAWQPSFAPFGAGNRAAACAIDLGLLEALRACAAQARLIVVSVQPHLVAAFNRACAAVRGENAWFVTVEGGQVAMAAFRQDSCVGVRNEPLDGDIGPVVAAMLAQDALSRELAAADCHAYVHAPGWAGALPAPTPAWSMHRVDDMRAPAAPRTGAAAVDPASYPLTLGGAAAA